ncbi:hypothetical protein [Streptomyces luteocolor]|uniref:hypothetical protein n=1 Tax=Streptomyces luteocolor TaxID=285500 RepID=UPI000853B14C|nr:hypothetical protein [Streptomyces luteocolor]
MTEQPGDHLRRLQPAWQLLKDAILVHTRASSGDGANHVASAREHDGIILCGSDALPAAGTDHRQGGSRRLQLVDPDSYGDYATADAPFLLESHIRNGQPTLFDETDADELRHHQEAQLRNGATAGLTPTRYIKGGDRPSVAAAVQAVRDLDPQQTILTLPLDQQWLRDADGLDYLVAELADVPHIKALALGSAMNPLAAKGAVTGLRRLIGSLDRVALIRTDLAGLDAYAHGALFTAIGMQTAMRHVRKPGSRGAGGRKPNRHTTMVLHPQLMDYYRAETLRDLYGRRSEPLCHCTVCEGASLLRFDHNARDQEEANRHNIATWLPWADHLQRTEPGTARKSAWQQLCHDARNAHQELREDLSAPGALETPRWLKVWAGDPD